VQTRVETWQVDVSFDAIISRAFASITDFVNVSLQHLAQDGYLYAMKGQLHEQEWQALPSSVHIVDTQRLSIPAIHAERHLITLQII
jgi:16S rRNA (guanine527-N7)-methyltransferase